MPTWIARAPARVNLIGEHVDYVGGLVLPCAVDRYVTVEGDPADRWDLVSEVGGGLQYAKALGAVLGVEPHRVLVRSDIPAGFGMSSSAALLVAMARGLRPDLDGVQAASLCRKAEQEATGVQVGVMDQFAAALGRSGHAILLDCDSLFYRYVPFPKDVAIGVLDSGVRRRLEDTPYNQRRQEAIDALGGRKLLEIADIPDGAGPRLRHLVTEVARVREFARAMEASDLEVMGRLMNESHESLRDDFEVSTPELDALVENTRRQPGCLGARLMGAGFGGSVVALFREPAPRLPSMVIVRTADGAYV